MSLGKDYEREVDCAVARGLELIGERWTMLVVRDAFYGVRRYGDFLAHLELPRAVLADRLAALTEAGVLEKRPYRDAPVREEYVLTAMGRGLWPTLAQLGAWSTVHLMNGRFHRKYLHADCGTRLVAATYCPQCGPVGPEDVEIHPGPDADRSRTDAVSLALREPRRLLTPIRE